MKEVELLKVKLVRESCSEYDISTRKVSTPSSVRTIVNRMLDLENEPVEKFGIVCLDTKNNTTGVHVVSSGTLNFSLVHPREVFKAAILNNSASIILFHNHPSGNPTPSDEDMSITGRLYKAGELMGIPVLDHVIIGFDDHFSFQQEGIDFKELKEEYDD